tara:strand:+ start:828 stop:1907 length:1080 start_codon:yes stop_codon:yes gene_type:complete
MKIEVNKIKPNPFKKQINKGKLNREQIDKIKQNLNKIGFFGVLTLTKRKDNYYLVCGHHRLQALKEFYGDKHKVSYEIKDYDGDQLLKAMVIENLAQRGGSFQEEKENIVMIEKHLNDNSDVLQDCRESRQSSIKSPLKSKREDLQKATSQDIAFWLDENSGKVIKKDVIINMLNIHHRLDKELEEEIIKTHDQPKEIRENTLNYSQAVILSSIEDKQEQRELAKALKNSKEIRVREQGKLITEYKKSDNKIKEKVRKGDIDIKDISFENHKKEVGNFNLNRDKLFLEQHIDLRQTLSSLFTEKLFLNKSSPTELEVTYHYILNWVKKDLIPFMKEIEIELKKKGSEKIVYFDLNERRK